jgi:hypothetical protein
MKKKRYHTCSHPDCASEISHWILRSDFDRDYRDKGRSSWQCPLGHQNSVLPSDEEIKDMNKVILYHPEYYTAEASLDRCPMRRYRICPGCVDVGCLMMAAHDDGCKQWPGGGARHQHVFCFHCTRFINVDMWMYQPCVEYMCVYMFIYATSPFPTHPCIS